MGVHTRESKTYLKVLASDGTIRQTVPQGTEGAVRRTYEDRETKAEKETFELVYDFIDGTIGDIFLFEGKFGDNLIIPISDGDSTFHLSLGTSTNFGEDFMKKLPNIDLTKPVAISPFSFMSDKGKPVRGVSIVQDFIIQNGSIKGGAKVKSYFYDDEAKKNINGYPDPDFDVKKAKPDDWKIYFAQARKFMVADLKAKGLIKDAASAPAADAAPDESAEVEVDKNF